ncbi:fetal and adult testis-expressed transcript protein isoform X1 [Python bivittatus]|uniref:Mitochondrial fission factor n=1 Tax=Python bivittatus TaxID=176946 RepID=A0A9F2RDF4_PYTBI|nr:fetal and adult testis-expressed transcript protein isoform X1 [Python bivittatus]
MSSPVPTTLAPALERSNRCAARKAFWQPLPLQDTDERAMCSARLDKANREAAFSEAVSRLMRVPSRLKVAVDDLPLDPTQDFPPFFWMQVPERLLPAEVKAVTFQPLAQRHCPFADGLFLEPATHKVSGQHTFLSFASQPGPQKNKPLTFLDTTWGQRMPVETPQVAMERIRQRQGRLEPSTLPPCPRFPVFSGESRIYSWRNVLQALHFLGLQLLQLLWKPRRVQISSREMNLVSDGSPEESGTPEIMAMRRQLSNISGQLRVLEEQSVSWRQKELFIYSMLVSACLFNMWLWLRR